MQLLKYLLRDLAAAQCGDGAVGLGELPVDLLQVVLADDVRLGQVVVHLQHLVPHLKWR